LKEIRRCKKEKSKSKRELKKSKSRRRRRREKRKGERCGIRTGAERAQGRFKTFQWGKTICTSS
jgi:hypothetical protein